MIIAILSLAVLGLGLGLMLGFASKYLKVEAGALVREISDMLPGSQCGQCGFPGCGPAAEAVAGGQAPVTLCPPGGPSLALALANKLGVSADLSGMEEHIPKVAFINERLCIGCTKCFKRCPTDALVGANRQIHVVIRDACTGCGKCVEVCPTESVQLREEPETLESWHWPKPQELPAAS
ncbi:MAG: RnfABCDGE type electron transport complex subunit B [Alphaproteobacteria bacterium]|nr:RnfABCDGE type electron transport complex subunit B [Alphaproteobacteria bacterium]MBF0249376.1 RnfABCDGE type electron transport complex subunit B [Alphaproteobacteria bacterium]